jgi:hypothetical protein
MLLEKHLTASKGLVVNLCFCRVAIEVTKNKWQKVKIEIGKESKKKQDTSNAAQYCWTSMKIVNFNHST